MAGQLIERNGTTSGAMHPLLDKRTTIGRAAHNDIVFERIGISREHAEIDWNGKQYVVTDLGSKNGTYLNGERLTEPQPLRHGDILGLPGQPPLHLYFEENKTTETVRFALPSIADPNLALSATAPAGFALWVDQRKAEVHVGGRTVAVTAKEYLALSALYTQAGALVTKDELAKQVWPEYNGAVADENIEQLISRLRRKLEPESERPRFLITVRGLGYRLNVN